jgi:leucyl-tRNA synthetase
MWEKLGYKPAIANAGWPAIDKSLLGADNVIAILQINGKIKDRIEVSPNITKDELEKLAKENPEIKAALIGADIKKIIAVAPKLVNFVI